MSRLLKFAIHETWTYSTEYSFCPIGWQIMNNIALHKEWKSLHSSTVITPFWGTDVCHTSSWRNDWILFNMTSTSDKPQHNLSLVRSSPSWAIDNCCKTLTKLTMSLPRTKILFTSVQVNTMGCQIKI